MESDIKKLDKIFYCDYHKRVEEIKKSTNKLVHYTSASAGLKILQNKEIWMRRVSCMNDFSEVQHGKDLFIDLWKNTERDTRVILLCSVIKVLVRWMPTSYGRQLLILRQDC